MASSFFQEILSKRFNPGAVLDLKTAGKVLIISDFHMGQGRRDDFKVNSEIVINILEEYYFKNGFTLILNGDIEELAKYTLSGIRSEWPQMYRVFDLFAAAGRLYKTLGNHDEDLVFEKDYPYPLYHAVRVETVQIPVYVYHGHQSSRVYTDFNNYVALAIKYILKPFGIRNISSARSPRRRFHVERQAYNFSLGHNCISIIGHTHRSLFESLGRFDYIKFEIERLCRDFPSSSGQERERIIGEVKALRGELSKLKRKERLEGLKHSLYGDEIPLPCLFNSGSAIGKKGVNAIELDTENIALVYWFAKGKGMKFINRGWYKVEEAAGFCRSVLNRDKLDFIKGKIELFSNFKENPGGGLE